MFSSCCCVSKKALKKAKDEQTKVSEKESELGNEVDNVDEGTIKPPKCDNNNSLKSPQPSVKADTATDAGKVSEKGQNGGEDGYNTNNDKSNSSEEDSAILSGLIMSDGLVGEDLKNPLTLVTSLVMGKISKFVFHFRFNFHQLGLYCLSVSISVSFSLSFH